MDILDILKKLLSNTVFDHLAENIIIYMDTDEAMEMIESEVLSDEERKVVRKILRKLMFKEAQMRCEKEMTMVESFQGPSVKTRLLKLFPLVELPQLKNSESLESFNQLYNTLMWLKTLRVTL